MENIEFGWGYELIKDDNIEDYVFIDELTKDFIAEYNDGVNILFLEANIDTEDSEETVRAFVSGNKLPDNFSNHNGEKVDMQVPEKFKDILFSILN